MPIAIAYSRFAWDSSQTILAMVLVLYFALATVDAIAPAGQADKMLDAGRPAPPDWLPALLAFGVAVWIHPTNVFARVAVGGAGGLPLWRRLACDGSGGLGAHAAVRIGAGSIGCWAPGNARHFRRGGRAGFAVDCWWTAGCAAD